MSSWNTQEEEPRHPHSLRHRKGSGGSGPVASDGSGSSGVGSSDGLWGVKGDIKSFAGSLRKNLLGKGSREGSRASGVAIGASSDPPSPRGAARLSRRRSAGSSKVRGGSRSASPITAGESPELGRKASAEAVRLGPPARDRDGSNAIKTNVLSSLRASLGQQAEDASGSGASGAGSIDAAGELRRQQQEKSAAAGAPPPFERLDVHSPGLFAEAPPRDSFESFASAQSPGMRSKSLATMARGREGSGGAGGAHAKLAAPGTMSVKPSAAAQQALAAQAIQNSLDETRASLAAEHGRYSELEEKYQGLLGRFDSQVAERDRLEKLYHEMREEADGRISAIQRTGDAVERATSDTAAVNKRLTRELALTRARADETAEFVDIYFKRIKDLEDRVLVIQRSSESHAGDYLFRVLSFVLHAVTIGIWVATSVFVHVRRMLYRRQEEVEEMLADLPGGEDNSERGNHDDRRGDGRESAWGGGRAASVHSAEGSVKSGRFGMALGMSSNPFGLTASSNVGALFASSTTRQGKKDS